MDFNYLFWFDLAGAHYSSEVVAWMNENVYFDDKGNLIERELSYEIFVTGCVKMINAKNIYL